MNPVENTTTHEFQAWFTDETARSLTAKSLQSLALVVIFLITFIGNISVAFILYTNFSIKNIPNMLLFCLTTVNVLIAVLNMPFAVISTAADKWLFGNRLCEFSGFLNQYLTFTSNAMVTVIALYRYQAIANTFSPQITFRGAKWITLFGWFYCLVFTIPPLFGWNTYRFSRKKGFCTLHWQDGGSGMVYTLLVVLACFLIPFITIVFVYVRIGVITQYSPKNVRPEPASSSSRLPSNPSDANDVRSDVTNDVRSDVTARDNNSRVPGHRLSKRNLSGSKDSIPESKTISSVSYVMMTFVLFLAPYYVMNIASALSQDYLSATAEFTVAWLHYCHAAAVPVVYGYLNRRIRNFLKQLPWWPKCGLGCRNEQQ